MLRRRRSSAAIAAQNCDGKPDLSAGHERQLGHLIGDAVEPGIGEIREHHMKHDRMAGGGGANRHSCQRLLRDRRVAYAICAEARLKPFRVAEDADLDILAEEHNARVARHLLDERVIDRLDQSLLRHHACSIPPRPSDPAGRKDAKSSSEGRGACAAACAARSTCFATSASMVASFAASATPSRRSVSAYLAGGPSRSSP